MAFTKTTKTFPSPNTETCAKRTRQHKGFSVTNIDVKWRHISAGTAVEAKTEGAVIPLSSQNTKSYNFLPYDYLQTVNEVCSSLSWTVHTLLSVSSVWLAESWSCLSISSVYCQVEWVSWYCEGLCTHLLLSMWFTWVF